MVKCNMQSHPTNVNILRLKNRFIGSFHKSVCQLKWLNIDFRPIYFFHRMSAPTLPPPPYPPSGPLQQFPPPLLHAQTNPPFVNPNCFPNLHHFSLLIKSLSNNLVIGQVSLVSTYLTTCRSNHPYPLWTLIPPSCHLLPLTRPFPHKSSLYLHMGNKGNMLLSALTQRPSSWLLMEAVWILIP